MEPPGDLIGGRFTLLEKLGAGTYGEAWRARDTATNALAVVKLLHPQLVESDRARERFRREVRALAKLDHPGVVAMVDHGVCPVREQPFYAMQWCPGQPLSTILRAQGTLPLERSLRLIATACDALAHSHEAGILHRDLKPANLLLLDQRLVLIDFGLAKHGSGGDRTVATLTGGSLIGTPSYMAPEQCSGMPTGPATDVYALGCVLFELLAGRPPFQSKSSMAVISMHVMEAPPDLAQLVPAAPRTLVELLALCLHKDPGARPSASDFGQALRSIVSDPEQTVTSDAPRLAPGSTVGDFPLELRLGSGGFAAVFRTRLPDGTPAALKALPPSLAAPELHATERFLREVRLLKQLEHPILPRLHASGVDRGVHWLVMDLVEGYDLDEMMAREGGALTVAQLLPILQQILPGLDYLHRRGVVHCDLKPENLRIRRDGTVCVLDLGIAKLRDDSDLGDSAIVSQEGRVLGSTDYVPPEFSDGRHGVSPAADVYAMGVTIYFALTGALPFAHSANPDPVPLQSRAPHLDRALCALVMRCLAKDPQARPTTGGELLNALNQAIDPTAAPVADLPTLAPPELPWVLRRMDRDLAPLPLDVPQVLGRSPHAAAILDDSDTPASAHHCRLTPAVGRVRVEVLEGATFKNDEPVMGADTLRPGDVLALGNLDGPRFRVEEAASPTLTAALGRSTVPLPDSGDALRGKLDLELNGRQGRLFLFAGTRLRFGRNRVRKGARQNDLLLRCWPKEGEIRRKVRARTNSVSGHHGTFFVTQNGVAVRDDGSTLGTDLDGRTLPGNVLTPLGDRFFLDIAGVMGLRGCVFRAQAHLGAERTLGMESGHPVACVRLERTRDGEHHSYVLLIREISLGSGPEDALCLPHPSVAVGHARLRLRNGRFALSALREDAPVRVSGHGEVEPGAHVPLQPGAEIQLGEVTLRFTPVTDDDMVPPR